MSDTSCNDIEFGTDVIKASPLGEELTDAQCERLASIMTACSLKDRDFLIEEGHKDNSLHVLVKGNIEVVSRTGSGDQVGLHILREGDILGELGFLDGVEHSAGLRAMGNCDLLRLERDSFEGLLETDSELVYKVMRSIVRTVHRILRNMNCQQVELTNYIARQHGRY
jgi:CRP/FNR family cyclic AMP-dependent transcriptional regulator